MDSGEPGQEVTAELIAIELWDDLFEKSTDANQIDIAAFWARQGRKAEILRQILPHFYSINSFGCPPPKLSA